jgi:2-keto-3-deoxy-6-phosphogluconate aldolase
VAIDSADWALVVKHLRDRLSSNVALGIGNVMEIEKAELERARALGVSFAASPIEPFGFMEECRRLGILPVPSAFTATECWNLHRRGAQLIKLFHAGCITPVILKSMLEGTPLSAMGIMPSGGVEPGNARLWIDAGAVVVRMDNDFAGKDVTMEPGTEAHRVAEREWLDRGRLVAQTVFRTLAHDGEVTEVADGSVDITPESSDYEAAEV